MDIEKYISQKKKIVDKTLDRYLPSIKTRPQIIHKVMRYAVFPGGKRIRPILTIASFEACGGKTNSIMPVACGIELIHTYTLIHDDLPCMDNDDLRRGKPSCHKKFGEAISLLAGDALLTLAFQLFSEAGNTNIIKEISRTIGSRGTIGGQVVDIIQQRADSREERADLDYIASHKTGLLFEVAVKVGGMFKGVDRKKINALSAFGRDIGFTFQLIDDLMDKDGYAELYGPSYVRKKAEYLAKKAESHLNIFEDKAIRLSEIADLILERSP